MSALSNGVPTAANLSSSSHAASGSTNNTNNAESSYSAMNKTKQPDLGTVTGSSLGPDSSNNESSNDIISNSSSAAALRSASSPAEVRAALAALHTREEGLTAKLDSLAGAHADLNRDLLRLDSLRATLGSQVIAARSISNTMLAGAADTAGRLSSRVRSLDLEKSRVESTLGVVEQVAELKACVAGVVGSMGAPQDWEAAAAYIARAARIPEAIVESGFASAVVPTVEVPDPPAVTLEQARESLCGLFLREFERAARDQDGARVTRFFKLFPLIGRGDVGLDVYGRYVCQGVAGTARAVLKEGTGAGGRRDGFFYANALTRLFEHIAQIVEGHGGLVERHYGGRGKMVRVIERLQMEADVQGGIILDSWSDERGIDRKLTDVKSYPFSFLVQSFLPTQKGGGGMGTPRVNSPALGGTGNGNPRSSEDEGGVSMKEVDGLLSEIAVMLGRWSLYSRFLAGKCTDPPAPADAPLVMPDVLGKSNLQRKVSAKLISPYNVMSTFFFRRSVEKGFQLDEMPSGLSLNMSKAIDSSPPYIISAVDDVMYIVNAVLQKCLSTSQREVVAWVIPTVGRVLGSDFVSMVQRKMRDESYPKPLVQGGFPPEDKIISFIVLINSLDMANEYLARIVSTRLGIPSEQQSHHANGASAGPHSSLKDSFPFDHDIAFVTNALNTLQSSFATNATELLNEGIQVLFNQVVKARLRPVLSDTFRDVDYGLTEEELADAAAAAAGEDLAEQEELLEQAQTAVPRRFEHGWDALVRPLGRLMTPRTLATLLDMAARYLARVLEKRVWTYAGRASAFGAVRMERDFGGIAAAVARQGNYAARELFARTVQILMVANMEDDEWEELGGEAAAGIATGGGDGEGGEGGDGEDDEGGIAWVLTVEERRRARNLVRH